MEPRIDDVANGLKITPHIHSAKSFQYLLGIDLFDNANNPGVVQSNDYGFTTQ